MRRGIYSVPSHVGSIRSLATDRLFPQSWQISPERLRQYTNLRTLLLDPSASQSRRRRPTTRSSRRRRYSLVSPVRGLSREAELKTTLPPQRVMESILFAAAGGPVPLPHISTGLGTRGPGWLSTRDARRL